MPRDVAVHEPGARVVGTERDDQIASRGQQGHVSSRWVIRLQVDQTVPIPTAGLLEDRKVMPVKMNLAALVSICFQNKVGAHEWQRTG